MALIAAVMTVGAIAGISKLFFRGQDQSERTATAAKNEAKDSTDPRQELSVPTQPHEPEMPANEEVTPDKPIDLEFSPYLVGGPSKVNYPWKDDHSYTCFFDVTMESDEFRHEISGISSYDALDPNKSKLGTIGASGGGTGTAFVVSRRGYLVTCAHVVLGAKTVHVGIDGNLVLAEVVVYDPRNDLAVLKVEEKDLTVLPLAEVDELQEGVPLRAMGFPLASTLGASLKASRGKLVSIDEDKLQGELEVDADLNPGNSGGPIINDLGRVLGVASTVNDFDNESNIGHAVSTKTLRRLLADQGVPFETNSNSRRLTGPQAIRYARSAVALVVVETGPDGFAGAEQSVRKVNCKYDLSIRRLRHFPYAYSPQFSWSMDGETLVDTAGELHETTEDFYVPYLSVHGGLMGISTLPTANLDKWDTRGEGVIAFLPYDADPTKKAVSNGWLGFPHLYPNHLGAARKRSSRFGVMPGKALPALEFAEYKVVASNEKVLTVRMQTGKFASGDEEGDARVQLEAEAEIEYFKENALISKMQWVGLLTLGSNSEAVELPIQASLRFGEGGYFGSDNSPALPAEWKRVQDDLSSDRRTAQLLGLTKLVNDLGFERESVLEVIAPFLDQEDSILRRAAARAFVKRCDDTHFDALIELMQDEDIGVSSLAAERFCKFKNDLEIAVIADLLDNHIERELSLVVDALHSAGKDSERIFLALVNHPRQSVRQHAITFLGRWGGPDTKDMAYRRMRAGMFVGDENDLIHKLFWKLAPPNHGSFRVRVVDAKPKLGESAVKLTRELDSAESKELQFVALKKLGLINSTPRFLKMYSASLNKFLKTEDHELRILAYGLLKRMGTDENISAMIEATNHENYLVRWAGMDGLRQFGSLHTARAIAERLSEPLDVRAARKALVRMYFSTGTPEVRTFIMNALR
jgi:S1-C subfamily serine protease/HEAT repeat protein